MKTSRSYFKFTIILIIFQLLILPTFAQFEKSKFTRQDTLRGSITPEREWWDLTYYHLDLKVDPDKRSIEGSNLIQYKVLREHQLMQIDLQPPLEILKVQQKGKELPFKKDGNAWFIQLTEKQKVGDLNQILVYYGGKPKISRRPPWDGGFTWEKDSLGKPFIATSCQGDGASLWWPCKDHMYDEPDSMLISVTVPNNLINVSNGRLRKTVQNKDNTKTFHWFVANPINNYGVNVNIGDYVHFSEKYMGEKGELDCDYYVLKNNLEKAKKQFKQVKLMLEAFEYWFGPYPFYEDSYKLVEVPYLGMEHQSSVTYGNGYTNGFRGSDLSATGWGLKFDFIIIHESGHEWFANSITYKDIADMWIHESFIAYSENLYLDYHYGKKAGEEYTLGTRQLIQNDRPIIGEYDVNSSGSGDMYYKGANMLHSLRQIVNDDEKWRSILRGLNKEFYHQTVTTEQIESYIIEQTGLNLSSFFNQYLRDTRIPIFEYRFNDHKLIYRWGNSVEGFNMPIKIYVNDKELWLKPTKTWKTENNIPENPTLKVNPDFYIAVFNLTGK